MGPKKTTGKKCETLLIWSLFQGMPSEYIPLLKNQHIPYYIENFSLFKPINLTYYKFFLNYVDLRIILYFLYSTYK